MASEILIMVRPQESRVAYIENGTLNDLKIERRTSPTLVGSIYQGKVSRVLPGMQAAFVDIGLDRAAFLYVGDVREDLDEGSVAFLKDEDEHDDAPSASDSPTKPKIQELLSEGQMIMVQVAKDPIGSKGARITTHISLPGRHVVFLPTVNHLGISRRIGDEAERERLRKVVEAMQPQGGVIVRTAAEGASEVSLQADLDYLGRLWQEIKKSIEKKSKPGLVHSEPVVELRALRDLLSEEVDRVVTDNEESFKRISNFVSQFMPKYRNKIQLYQGNKPLFDSFDIDFEISRSMARKIWLKSGGYIVIDEAEALVVVDVNTGSYVGKKDFDETILKTNLEAVREIAHQLRIRNCGGIIILDLIDMEKEAHREQVLASLQDELKKDRARPTIISMSNLGLVEMTRKRNRPSLMKTLCEPCEYCEGRGYVKQITTVANEIFRELEREAARHQGPTVAVRCHPKVGDYIYEEATDVLEEAERRIKKQIVFRLDASLHREQYDISAMEKQT